MGTIVHLQKLYLDSNNLTGYLPTEMGANNDLSDLHLGGNQITGPIPTSWGNMKLLTSLELTNMNLWGPIPQTWVKNFVNECSIQNSGLCNDQDSSVSTNCNLNSLPSCTNLTFPTIPVDIINEIETTEKVHLQVTIAQTVEPNAPIAATAPQASTSPTIIIISVVLSVLVAFGVVFAIFWRRRQLKRYRQEFEGLDSDFDAVSTSQSQSRSLGTESVSSRGGSEKQSIINDFIQDTAARLSSSHDTVHYIKELNRGGFGVVWKARYKGRFVAVCFS